MRTPWKLQMQPQTRYLVVIDAAGEMVARMFDAAYRQRAEFDVADGFTGLEQRLQLTVRLADYSRRTGLWTPLAATAEEQSFGRSS